MEGYYACPADEETTKAGRWIKGPGADFLAALKQAVPGARLVAEDLGTAGYNMAANDARNKGAFVMGAESMDIERLLSRSQSLAQGKGKGGGK